MNKRSIILILLLLTTASASSAQQTPPAPGSVVSVQKMKLISREFENGSPIPKRFTCDGDNISPQLFWGAVPEDTKSIALLCEDPDAPNGSFVHWVVYNMPGITQGILENKPKTETLKGGAHQGKNGAGTTGYTGPCPPPGKIHHYYFRVLALDQKLNLTGDVTRGKLMAAIKGHVLGMGQLMGTYQK